MLSRIFLFLTVVFFGIVEVHGNDGIERLRRDLGQAPDSDKAGILVRMAELYESDNRDSCAFYARRASETAKATQQDMPLIAAEMILCRLAFGNADYVRASEHGKKALDAALIVRDWELASQCYYDLGMSWLLRNNYAEAIDNLKKGLAIARERNNPALLGNYYQSLIHIYQKLYNQAAVNEYYPLLVEANRRVDAGILTDSVAALQKAFEARLAEETEKTARKIVKSESAPLSVGTGIIVLWAILATLLVAAAIIFYRYRITAITAKDQKKLDDTVTEFETMKNNQSATFKFLTQYAYTGIDRLSRDIGSFVEEQGSDILPAIDNALNRINNDMFSLYGFFQNFLLLLQAQSGQLSPELSSVNIPQLATNILSDYEPFAAANEIKLVNDVQNNVFVTADERLVDTVLRNLMSNAFKYTPHRGMITLGAKEGYTDMEIWVTDDGMGFTSEQASKLFELSENLFLPGKPDLKGYGLGLVVCKALIENCNGRIWAETKPDEGFCIRFSLPKAVSREIKIQS